MSRIDGAPAPEAERPTEPEPAVAAPAPPESVRSYLSMWLVRLRGGETGVLPVVAGLLLVSVLFQSLNGHFLTAGNLVNLLVQAAVFSLLAMGEVFALLLGEIDLSIGFVAGVSAVVMCELANPTIGWPWWAAIAAALVASALIGLLHGTLITRIGLPSFVVTLAGLLFWQGVMLWVLGSGGSILIQDNIINDIGSGTLTRGAGWVVTLVIVGVFAVLTWRHDVRRRESGLVAPPRPLTIAKILAALLGGVALVLLVNADRGILVPVLGMPWVVLLVFSVLALWTYVLGRRRFGLYVYAIGGNAEAARRAGISLARIRPLAFMLCSLTAGIGGRESHVFHALATGLSPSVYATSRNIHETEWDSLVSGLRSRGLVTDDGHSLTDAGREIKAGIESTTDDLAESAYAVLDEAEVEELIGLLRPLTKAVAAAGDPPPAHRVAVAGRLDLDDVGAVVAEQLAGERAGDEAAHLEHADPREGPATRHRHVR